MNAEVEELDREVALIEGPTNNMALVSAISKAELDQQITTARAFPRSLKKFVNECRDMACLNEKVAAECYYVVPRGGKNIEGPSIRLGEIVQSAWGNCQSGARVVDEGDEFVTAQGVFYDLERNSKVTMEVRRRITDREGRRFNADMIGVTGNAACSIALRNAIFRGIPKAFWNDIYMEARKVAAGNIKSLVTNRTEALNWLARKGVTEATVLAALGVAGVEDIGLDELTTLRGMVTAIKDEGVSVEVAFAPKDAPPAGKPKTTAPRARKKKDEPKAAAEPTPSATPAASPKPDFTPLTLDQQNAIADKLKEEGVELNALLAKYEVGRLEELSSAAYEAILNTIGELSNA